MMDPRIGFAPLLAGMATLALFLFLLLSVATPGMTWPLLFRWYAVGLLGPAAMVGVLCGLIWLVTP